jgi:hypothetical protein
MNPGWKVMGMACFLAAWASDARGQSVAPPASEEGRPSLLTLSSPMLRATMDRMNLSWVFPERLPDFRLKMERPAVAGPFSPEEMQRRLRGVEFRLPMEGVWVGYEKTAEDEQPRATISIQRGF